MAEIYYCGARLKTRDGTCGRIVTRHGLRCTKHMDLMEVETPAQETLAERLLEAFFEPKPLNIRVMPITTVCTPAVLPDSIFCGKSLPKCDQKKSSESCIPLNVGLWHTLSILKGENSRLETYGGKDFTIDFKVRGPKIANVLKNMLDCNDIVVATSDAFFYLLRKLHKANSNVAGVLCLEHATFDQENRTKNINQSQIDHVKNFYAAVYALHTKKFDEFTAKLNELVDGKESEPKKCLTRFMKDHPQEVYQQLYTLREVVPEAYESFNQMCGEEFGETVASLYGLTGDFPFLPGMDSIGIFYNPSKVQLMSVNPNNDNNVKTIPMDRFNIFVSSSTSIAAKFRKHGVDFTVDYRQNRDKPNEANIKENDLVIFMNDREGGNMDSSAVYINALENVVQNRSYSRNSDAKGNRIMHSTLLEGIYIDPRVIQKKTEFLSHTRYGFNRPTLGEGDLNNAVKLDVGALDARRDLSDIKLGEEFRKAAAQIYPNDLAPSSRPPQSVSLQLKNLCK